MLRSKSTIVTALSTAFLILGLVGTLGAHDFWLVPNAFQIAVGDSVSALGQTSSRFPTTESAVAVDRVADARLVGATSETRITGLSIAGKSLRLAARPTQPGQYIVAAGLYWRSMRESAGSFRRYLELEGAPAALERIDREGLLRGRDSVTRRYAKYAKTFVQVGDAGGRAFSRVLGQPLEFVPLSDPSSLRAGDTLSARLILLGSPAPGARAHAGAVHWMPTSASEPREAAKDVDLVADANGVVRIPISSAGLWNVRTIQIVQSPAGAGADWDAHWATLVFHVGGPMHHHQGAGDSASVAAAVRSYHDALRRGDSSAVLALLADDAVILETGGVETKADYRAGHLSGDIRFAQAVPSQSTGVRVAIRGDVAWAWSTSTTTGEMNGRQINSVGAELMVLTRTAAGWKINAIHWSSRARRP